MKLNGEKRTHQISVPIRDDGRGPGHILVLRVGSDGTVRGELELVDGRNIGGGGKHLEGGLLLRVSDVDGDLGGAKVLQGRSRNVGIFNPLNGLLLTGLPRGGRNWRGGLHFVRGQRVELGVVGKREKTHVNGGESRGQGSSQSQQESSGTHYEGE